MRVFRVGDRARGIRLFAGAVVVMAVFSGALSQPAAHAQGEDAAEADVWVDGLGATEGMGEEKQVVDVDVKMTGKPARLSFTVDRVRHVTTAGFGMGDSGFPPLADAMLAMQTVENADGAVTASGGGAGGAIVFDTEMSKQPNLILDIKMNGGKLAKGRRLICHAFGKPVGKDDKGRRIAGPLADSATRFRFDGIEYPQGADDAAVHLYLGPEQVDAVRIAELEVRFLVCEGTVQSAEFSGKELTEPTTKRDGKSPIRLVKLDAQDEQLRISVAVAPLESRLEQQIQSGRVKDIDRAMREEMLLNLPGRVSVMIIDSHGDTHYASMANIEQPIEEGVATNGDGGRNAKAGDAMLTHIFGIPALPEGVEVQSVTCTVTTCLRFPDVVTARFRDVPLRGEGRNEK